MLKTCCCRGLKTRPPIRNAPQVADKLQFTHTNQHRPQFAVYKTEPTHTMRYGALYIYTIFVFLYFMAQMCVRADSRDIAPVSKLFKSFDLSNVIFYYKTNVWV